MRVESVSRKCYITFDGLIVMRRHERRLFFLPGGGGRGGPSHGPISSSLIIHSFYAHACLCLIHVGTNVKKKFEM